MSNEDFTEDERRDREDYEQARRRLANAEKERDVQRAIIKAIQQHCEHRLTSEVYCTGKPEGARCRVCGKVWD